MWTWSWGTFRLPGDTEWDSAGDTIDEDAEVNTLFDLVLMTVAGDVVGDNAGNLVLKSVTP